jgi:hypothetical protein
MVFYLYKIGHQWWYGGTQTVKSSLGGTQRSKVMIWGSASTKKVDNPCSKGSWVNLISNYDNSISDHIQQPPFYKNALLIEIPVNVISRLL